MIKEIKIFNRFTIEKFARTNGLNFPYNCWYLISIHSGDHLINPNIKRIFEKVGCKGLMSIEFWDVTLDAKGPTLAEHPHAVVFDVEHAKKIIGFIDKIQKDNRDVTLVIHCHAGISRSGAVGTFACDYCGLDYNKFLKNNPGILPNHHILGLLRRTAKMTPSFGTHNGIDPPVLEGVRK